MVATRRRWPNRFAKSREKTRAFAWLTSGPKAVLSARRRCRVDEWRRCGLLGRDLTPLLGGRHKSRKKPRILQRPRRTAPPCNQRDWAQQDSNDPPILREKLHRGLRALLKRCYRTSTPKTPARSCASTSCPPGNAARSRPSWTMATKTNSGGGIGRRPEPRECSAGFPLPFIIQSSRGEQRP